jgi:hypothetical protein
MSRQRLLTPGAALLMFALAPLLAQGDELAKLKAAVQTLQARVDVLEHKLAALEPLRIAEERRQQQLQELEDLDGTPGPIASTGQVVDAEFELTVGQVLQAEHRGHWWGVKIVELLEDGKARVHFLGWAPEFDEVVDRSRLQLDANAWEKAKQTVALGALGTLFVDPSSEAIDGFAQPPGSISSTEKAVTAETQLTVGQTLQVEWGGAWWAARIMELLETGKIKIHYLGFDALFDEVVDRSRLQLDPDAESKARASVGVGPAWRVYPLPRSVKDLIDPAQQSKLLCSLIRRHFRAHAVFGVGFRGT